MKVDLKVDFCSYEAAKWAVEHWHYSKQLPVGKAVNVGVWEHSVFVGVVHFRNGSNQNMSKPYGLSQWECIELARVALKVHLSPVSQIVSKAIKLLKKHNPGLRLIISFADPDQNHVGTIYQAMNWTYTGDTGGFTQYRVKGKWYHQRSFRSSDWSKVSGVDYKKFPSREMPGRYRYLYPLDRAMRKQIEPLAKPYPKKENVRLASGSTLATSQGRGFDSHQAALVSPESQNEQA